MGLDPFLRGYVEGALFSSVGEDGRALERDFSPEDLSPEVFAEMRWDCEDFVQSFSDQLRNTMDEIDRWERAGMDFWLTRNRHGAGFWDGDWDGYTPEWMREIIPGGFKPATGTIAHIGAASCWEWECGHCRAHLVDPDSPLCSPCYTHGED